MSNLTEPIIKTEVARMTTDEIYTQNVERLMLAGSTELITNNLPQHAAALLSCFLRNAKGEVKIFCNTLRRQVYDSPEVLSSMLGAARRGISMQILVRRAPEEGSEFLTRFSSLSGSQPDKFSLQENAEDRSEMVKNHAETNFAIMDRKAYRWETDCKDVHAIACMNAPDLAVMLSNIFDRLYASTRRLEVPAAAA